MNRKLPPPTKKISDPREAPASVAKGIGRIEQRSRLCRQLLAAGYDDREVRAVIAQRFGIALATARLDVQRARKDQMESFQRSFDEHRAEAYELYRSIATNRNAKDADRLRAQERIDRLLGLDPTLTTGARTAEVDGQADDGNPAEELARIRDQMGQLSDGDLELMSRVTQLLELPGQGA